MSSGTVKMSSDRSTSSWALSVVSEASFEARGCSELCVGASSAAVAVGADSV